MNTLQTPKLPKSPKNADIEAITNASVSKWQLDPSPQNADEMLGHLSPILDYSVKQFGGAYSGPNLRSRAKVIALDSLQKYKADKGPVLPYLKSHLQGLQRFSGQETAAIPVSERNRLIWNQLQRQTTELTDELGREPSDVELSDYVRLPTKKLTAIRRAATSGASEGMYGDSNGVAVQTKDDTWQKFIHLTLPTNEQFIMEHTLGMNGKQILGTKELARSLGVTPAAISQRKAKIQKLLDSRRAS